MPLQYLRQTVSSLQKVSGVLGQKVLIENQRKLKAEADKAINKALEGFL